MEDELETIVQKMMDAGESEDDIAAVIQAFPQEAANSPEMNFAKVNGQDVPVGDPTKPESPVPVGVLAGLGTVAKNANTLLRPGIAAVGRGLVKARNAPGMIGRTLGASAGAAAGAMVGGPFTAAGGATLGAGVGGKYGKQMAEPIAKVGRAIEKTFSLASPRATMEEALQGDKLAMRAENLAKKAARLSPRSKEAFEMLSKASGLRKAVPRVGQLLKFGPGRKAVNFVGSRVLPGVGTALMVADAANTGYQAGQYLDKNVTVGGRHMSDIVGRTLAPFFGSSGKDYDAMVKALAQQELDK